MRIKKNDKVKIISGEYNGVEGHVLKSFPTKNKIIVEKVNFIKKHQRPTQQNPSGGVIEMEAPIHNKSLFKIININISYSKSSLLGQHINHIREICYDIDENYINKKNKKFLWFSILLICKPLFNKKLCNSFKTY